MTRREAAQRLARELYLGQHDAGDIAAIEAYGREREIAALTRAMEACATPLDAARIGDLIERVAKEGEE